jgi:hypothetical protein
MEAASMRLETDFGGDFLKELLNYGTLKGKDLRETEESILIAVKSSLMLNLFSTAISR